MSTPTPAGTFMIADIPCVRLRLGPPLVGRHPQYSVPGSLGVRREGCVRRAFPDTHTPKNRELDEKMRRIG